MPKDPAPSSENTENASPLEKLLRRKGTLNLDREAIGTLEEEFYTPIDDEPLRSGKR